MADTTTATAATTATERAPGYVPEPTGWTGWVLFASIMMILAGALQAIYGLVALLNDQWVVWGNRADLYLTITTWGWLHLILGIVVLLAGIGVLTGNVLARIVGVAVATVSFVSSFLFLPAYPLWCLTVMVIDGFVIWALIVHGDEMRAWRQADIDLR